MLNYRNLPSYAAKLTNWQFHGPQYGVLVAGQWQWFDLFTDSERALETELTRLKKLNKKERQEYFRQSAARKDHLSA